MRRGQDASHTYWRTLKADGFLSEKYPGGQDAQKKRLEAEGTQSDRRGKRFASKATNAGWRRSEVGPPVPTHAIFLET